MISQKCEKLSLFIYVWDDNGLYYKKLCVEKIAWYAFSLKYSTIRHLFISHRAEEEADFSAYNFRGDGYAVLPQIKRYKKRSYVVGVRFKTFDENALLFFAPNVQSVSLICLVHPYTVNSFICKGLF